MYKLHVYIIILFIYIRSIEFILNLSELNNMLEDKTKWNKYGIYLHKTISNLLSKVLGNV